MEEEVRVVRAAEEGVISAAQGGAAAAGVEGGGSHSGRGEAGSSLSFGVLKYY